jgi:TPR repeat protein
MNLKHSISILIIGLGLNFDVSAKELDINDAIELIQSDRTEEALPILYPLADDGHVGAMIALGYYFLFEKKNEAAGLDWFRNAAQSGDPEGQSTFGLVLTDVIGRYETIAEGVEWLEKAGNQGDRISAIKLAEIYYSGKGNVGKNIDLYNYWNERAQNY